MVLSENEERNGNKKVHKQTEFYKINRIFDYKQNVKHSKNTNK